MTDQKILVGNARGMFQFIRAVKQSGQRKAYTSLSRDVKDGFVLDLLRLPETLPGSPSGATDVAIPVITDDEETWGLDKNVLVVPRVRISDPPGLPERIQLLVDGRLDDPTKAPVLRQELIDVVEGASVDLRVIEILKTIPAELIVQAFDDYLKRWGTWADDELGARKVRELYLQVFESAEAAKLEPQTWEFVLGLGRLRSPATETGPAIDRPLLVVPVRAEVSGRTAQLSVSTVSGIRFRLETDMLRPGDLVSPSAVRELEDALAATPAEAFDLPVLVDRLRSFVNRGLRDVRMVDDAQWDTEAGSVVAIRPTLIRRKRGDQALVRALSAAIAQLEEAESLPEGLSAVVDPHYEGASGADQVFPDGGVVFHAGEPITPLPLNARQWDVLRRADSRPLALVQGPPGTGKTHTTAALISHLLAQGKRVLVTSARSEALTEVRDKLPPEIRNLAVTRLGGGQEETVQLRGAIEELSRRATEFNRRENDTEIAEAMEEIAELLAQRDRLIEDLIESRKLESERTSTPFGEVSIPELTKRWVAGRLKYDWAAAVLPEFDERITNPPFDQLRFLSAELSALAGDHRCKDARALGGNAPSLHSESAVRLAVESLRRSETVISTLRAVDERSITVLSNAPVEVLSMLESAVREASSARLGLSARPESWVQTALADIAFGRTASWTARRADISRRLGDAKSLAERVRDYEPIRTPDGDPAVLGEASRTLVDWAKRTGEFRLDAAGRPKFGMLAPKPIRQAWGLLGGSTLAGRSPQSSADLEVLRNWFLLQQRLDDLDGAWPQGTEVSTEDSPSERLAWHEDELLVLVGVLDLPRINAAVDRVIGQVPGLPPIAWSEPNAGMALLDAVGLVGARREHAQAESVLHETVGQLGRVGSVPAARRAAAAIEHHDADAFARAVEQLRDLYELRDRLLAADELHVQFRRSMPALAQLLPIDADSPWHDRLDQLEQAWEWRRLDHWLLQHRAGDPNAVHQLIFEVERRIRHRVGELAALRAWGLAVERLSPPRRADLQAYVNLVKRLGKGTGKYAARTMAEIQEVLDRAGQSVPVWIMPFTAVVETMSMRPDTFDAVIVDEASQLGIEGLLLAYISPRLVIVGDDKQVSPGQSAGRDQSLLPPLTAQFLAWNPQRAVYHNYDRSLFDEALMRFPDLITLTEHRRCVPAIIGFSDEIAYRPYNVRLLPVREPGSGALAPFVLTYVENGETTNATDKVNQREAEVLVDRLVEALNDPAYAGKTFGVISLQGTAQAKAIRALIASQVPPEVATSIRVGEPPNFQGAERDVIFLSMVAARNNKPGAMARDEYVQRFNVAVSRAVDQIHLVHSIRLDDGVFNTDDLRYRLLSYIAGLAEPPPAEANSPVDSDRLDPRFSNRLEQDLHDVLARKSYQVIPHYAAPTCTVDLVVVGETGKAGILCLDDSWPGEESYRRQLRNEADLLRFGWRLFRVRQTAMLVDPEGVTDQLIEFLARAGVHPAASPVKSTETSGSLTEPSQPEGPAPTPERFWELIQRSGGVLPSLLPDALSKLEPAAGLADCWTTNQGLIPAAGGPAGEADPAPNGSAVRWGYGRVTVRLVLEGLDLTVDAPQGHLGAIEATHPVRTLALARTEGEVDGDSLVGLPAPWRVVVAYSHDGSGVLSAADPAGRAWEFNDADPAHAIRNLLGEGALE